MQNNGTVGERKGRRWPLLLLIIPFIGTLWMPFYAFAEPSLAGSIPFFYWYQFLWVIISAVITAVVYVLTK